MLQTLRELIEGPSERKQASVAGEWPLDLCLYEFDTILKGKLGSVPWTLRDACEGTVVFGASGSGKTSGTAHHLARAFLEAGFGGLVLCAKPEESENWRRLARQAGREADIICFGDPETYRFNFLDYELKHGYGGIEAVVAVFMQILEVITPQDVEQDVWDRASRQLLRNLLELLRLAGEEIRIRTIYEMAISNKKVNEFVKKAEEREHNASASCDLELVKTYLQTEFRNMSDRTKSSILMTLSSMLDGFQRGVMRELFCTTSNISPEVTREGKIIVVDLPIKRYNELGQIAGGLWKFCFQRAMERAATTDETRPVFLFADECQFFTTSYDADFQTTARSARVASVYLTQNLPNLWVKYGGQTGKARTESLLGNLQTKIWHQNACIQTNEWAADTVSKILQERRSTSTQFSHQLGTRSNHGSGSGVNTQVVMDHDLKMRAFLNLLKGGSASKKVVTAVLFQGGRVYPNSKVWKQVGYQQRKL